MQQGDSRVARAESSQGIRRSGRQCLDQVCSAPVTMESSSDRPLTGKRAGISSGVVGGWLVGYSDNNVTHGLGV